MLLLIKATCLQHLVPQLERWDEEQTFQPLNKVSCERLSALSIPHTLTEQRVRHKTHTHTHTLCNWDYCKQIASCLVFYLMSHIHESCGPLPIKNRYNLLNLQRIFDFSVNDGQFNSLYRSFCLKVSRCMYDEFRKMLNSELQHAACMIKTPTSISFRAAAIPAIRYEVSRLAQ